ncbi:MAG TPA: acetylglutamate kinase, partial [Bacteroidia bacterium]
MKIKVIKVGGKVIDDPVKLNEFLDAFAAVDGLKVLVHGGGKIAGEVSNRLGLTVQQINGRRITDADTLETVVMVYAGLINKQIVASMQARGQNALGCCGADLNLIRSVKRVGTEIDFGYVGDVEVNSVASHELLTLLNNGIVPVFSAITHDGKGQLLNTNADAVASVLASALNRLMPCTLSLCFEGSAVMKGEELIRELNEEQ